MPGQPAVVPGGMLSTDAAVERSQGNRWSPGKSWEILGIWMKYPLVMTNIKQILWGSI